MSNNDQPAQAPHNQRADYVSEGVVESLFPGPGLPRMQRAQLPDREARAFLRMVNLSPRSAGARMSLQSLRQSGRLAALALGRRPNVASVHEQVIDGPGGPLTLRLFRPADSSTPLPALVWYFGGGFVVGDLDTAESICRSIALAAGCITVAVRYRLAPEYDLDDSHADALAALHWIAEHGAELGIDTSRLAVGGDSAGGNLAATVAHECVQRGAPAIKAQVLVYPATELVSRFPSYEENIHGGYLLTEEAVAAIEGYLAHSIETLDLTDPDLSPRRYCDLGGLPPAVVVSAGFDPIRDDGLDYVARLRAAGVPVESLHYPGEFHGFLNFDLLLGASRDALRRIGESLALLFGDEPARDRTLEVVDAAPACPSRLGYVAGEVASFTLTAWTATEGWSEALLRMVSPTTAKTCRRLLRPLLLPTIGMRRMITTRLGRLSAEQTYTATATEN